MKCFLCLKKKNLINICSSCECYSHKECLNKYYIPNCGYIYNKEWKFFCPLCKRESPHITNYDDIQLEKEKLLTILKNNLYDISIEFDRNITLIKTNDILCLVTKYKSILFEDNPSGRRLHNVIDNKLKEFYYIDNWDQAPYHYKNIFDKDISP